MKRLKHNCKKAVQHGVYAVEWAIVFPVFFVLMYAIVSYGLVFLVRESMQSAVEEGARAVLRYQPSRPARLQEAAAVVQQKMAWLPERLRPQTADIQVQVCRLASEALCSANVVCGVDEGVRCLARVQLEIPYGRHPLAPALPGLGALLPDMLTASASVVVSAERF